MASKTVLLKDADFAGIKIVFNGVSVGQAVNIEMALGRAKALDTNSAEFEYHTKSGEIKIVK